MDTPRPRVKPAFQGGPLPSLGKDENRESQFAENNGIDHDVPLVCAKPPHNSRIGRWFRGLTQNVGIAQVISQRIRRLKSQWHEEVLLRTGAQPVHDALVLRSGTADEAIVPTLETLNVELLPRFDTVQLPEL